MALATLCAQAQEQLISFRRHVCLTAFIVDHGTRPGSSQEAREIKGWLEGHLGT